MKLKLLLATFTILNLTVGESVLAQADFGNKPLDIYRAPESQIIKDFDRKIKKEVELLQINQPLLIIPKDYEYLDRDTQLIFEQDLDSDLTLESSE